MKHDPRIPAFLQRDVSLLQEAIHVRILALGPKLELEEGVTIELYDGVYQVFYQKIILIVEYPEDQTILEL